MNAEFAAPAIPDGRGSCVICEGQLFPRCYRLRRCSARSIWCLHRLSREQLHVAVSSVGAKGRVGDIVQFSLIQRRFRAILSFEGRAFFQLGGIARVDGPFTGISGIQRADFRYVSGSDGVDLSSSTGTIILEGLRLYQFKHLFVHGVVGERFTASAGNFSIRSSTCRQLRFASAAPSSSFVVFHIPVAPVSIPMSSPSALGQLSWCTDWWRPQSRQFYRMQQ